MAQIDYGIGHDDEGYFVGIRLVAKGQTIQYEAEGRFDHYQDAIQFLLALAKTIETEAAHRGMTIGPIRGLGGAT